MSTRGYRLCAGCNGNLDKSSYTKNQWAKGVGASRCKICVSELVEIDSNGFGTARRNEKSRCEFNFTKVEGLSCCLLASLCSFLHTKDYYY